MTAAAGSCLSRIGGRTGSRSLAGTIASRPNQVFSPHAEPNTYSNSSFTGWPKVFGELAVHRESLERVLSENPQSLASILLALISALGGQHSTLPAEEREKEGAFVLT